MSVHEVLYCSGFIKDNPDGQMTREKTFVNQIFSKYDTDNSGSIDFKR